MPGMAYTLCSTARGSVCGLVDVAAEAGPAGEKPCWIGYVGVDDVDAAATRAIALGGVVEVVPQTVPGVSRFAIITDPQFVPLGVLKWLMPRPQPAAPDTPGEIGWHELMARRRSGRLRLLSCVVRMAESRERTRSGGDLPALLRRRRNDRRHARASRRSAPSALWLHYFNVGDIDAAVKRATAGGGQGSPRPDCGPRRQMGRAMHGPARRGVRDDGTAQAGPGRLFQARRGGRSVEHAV